jgi:hypothetical protein
MSFHIVYSRHYWDTEDQGQFSNTWTIYRNVPYSQLSEMQKAIPSLLKNADDVYINNIEKIKIQNGRYFIVYLG